MEWASEDNTAEKAFDIAAAAVFAASVGFAAGAAGIDAAATITVAVGASITAFAALRSVSAGTVIYRLPVFEPVPLEWVEESADELVLEDRLGSLPTKARVIRLFDLAVESGRVPRPSSLPPDASQALTDALAELRRSLR